MFAKKLSPCPIHSRHQSLESYLSCKMFINKEPHTATEAIIERSKEVQMDRIESDIHYVQL